jgi:2TM domain
VDQEREEALRYVRRKRIFYTLVGIWLALSLMWFLIDLASGSDDWWFFWPMIGTGTAVLVTGLAMFGFGGLFGADWEQRQVESYLKRRGEERPGPEA